ncbi:aldo/keto reductase [Cupriavidus pauculus]|uniref:aldo/keto reductase n=1 Tax=Cupriavidus pauculus TaxID=82633 RepID=UPI0020A5CC6D|nr:aldo/keto reductase [Cupriavidus pauculus]
MPRSDVFVTTKIWNDAQGAARTRDALAQSLERLGLEYADLLLIHWPAPSKNLYIETWQAMIAMRSEGLVRSIGVSNFTGTQLARLIDETNVIPVLNQVELHPYMQQDELQMLHRSLNIHTQARSPLAQNHALSDEAIVQIATKHSRTPAQVVIRWHLESGRIVIPKSVTPIRIRSNAQVFDFSLDVSDHAAIARLDRRWRLGPDPDVLN